MAAVVNQNRRRASSLAERHPGGGVPAPDQKGKDAAGMPPRRACSLRERYPGDMSHRPLALLTQQHRAADRAPHLHNRRRQQPRDTIDSLDRTGPVPGATYHHDGPFDPTLRVRNVNRKYAPIEAVRDTNMEALKATPAEFVQDSLEKHVPLQGTAVVPPGMPDFSGRTMEYEEGADLMREEEDDDGAPYNGWEHMRYRDDELKGKGDPSFSVHQARREQKAARAQHRQQAAASTSRDGRTAVSYEMQPTPAARDYRSGGLGDRSNDAHKHPGSSRVRPSRSVSHAAGDPLLVPGVHDHDSDHGDGDGDGDDDDDDDDKWGGAAGSSGVQIQRRNTTGKSLAQSLRRRLGSLKKRREGGGK